MVFPLLKNINLDLFFDKWFQRYLCSTDFLFLTVVYVGIEISTNICDLLNYQYSFSIQDPHRYNVYDNYYFWTNLSLHSIIYSYIENLQRTVYIFCIYQFNSVTILSDLNLKTLNLRSGKLSHYPRFNRGCNQCNNTLLSFILENQLLEYIKIWSTWIIEHQNSKTLLNPSKMLLLSCHHINAAAFEILCLL